MSYVSRGESDFRSSRSSGSQYEFAVFVGKYCRAHRWHGPLAGFYEIGGGRWDPVEVDRARGREIVHFVVQRDAGAWRHKAATEAKTKTTADEKSRALDIKGRFFLNTFSAKCKI